MLSTNGSGDVRGGADMMPPCMKEGHDCLNRHAGCQPGCVDYLVYKWDQNRLNEELKPRKEALEVLCHSRRARLAIAYTNKFRR